MQVRPPPHTDAKIDFSSEHHFPATVKPLIHRPRMGNLTKAKCDRVLITTVCVFALVHVPQRMQSVSMSSKTFHMWALQLCPPPPKKSAAFSFLW